MNTSTTQHTSTTQQQDTHEPTQAITDVGDSTVTGEILVSTAATATAAEEDVTILSPRTATSPSSAQISAKKLGQYILIKTKIGTGSFAEVYKGYRKKDKLPVAIKVISRSKLNDKLMNSLEFEISILKKLNHEHIIKLFDVHKSPRHYYLVMEYCPGGDLTSYIRSKRGPLSEEVASKFLFDLALGLHALQKLNLVHRDLKPQNLLLTSKDENATIKIADFGFAREIQPNDLAETLCGSPLYMAPEILNNQKYNAKADLWSVGAILYEMLTGKQPYLAQNLLELIKVIKSKSVAFPSSLSPESVNLLQGLLQRDPEQRIDFDTFFNHPFLKHEKLRRAYDSSSDTVVQPVEQHQQLSEHASTDVVTSIDQRVEATEIASNEQHQPLTGEVLPPSASPSQQSLKHSRVTFAATNPVYETHTRAEERVITDVSSPQTQSPLSLASSSSQLRQTKISPLVEQSIHGSMIQFAPSTEQQHAAGSPPQSAASIADALSVSSSLTTSADRSYVLLGNRDLINSQNSKNLPQSARHRPVHELIKYPESGYVQFASSVFDFSSLVLDPAPQEHLSLLVSIENVAMRSWVICEAAYLNECFDQNIEAIVLYNKSLELLYQSFFQLRSQFDVATLQQSSGAAGNASTSAPDRPRALFQWLQLQYIDLLERAQKLKSALSRLLRHQQQQQSIVLSTAAVCPEIILYSYAIKLAKAANVSEYTEHLDHENCKAMYHRAKLVFEYLLDDCGIVVDPSDKDILRSYIRQIQERQQAISL